MILMIKQEGEMMEFTLEKLSTDKEKRRQYIMNDIENKLQWLEENTDHNIIYISLQGSQNYSMDIYTEEYISDIDVKAICIPSLDDVVRGKKMVSHTYVMENNSHIDVKDIRLYIDLWKKSNPQFLEILFTEFYICRNEKFKQILEMADRIAFANKDRLLSCIKGMQMEKFKALKHPYPTIKDKIEKYGYDPKQAHHIYRLLVFATDIYVNGKNFRESLVPEESQKKFCLNYKQNIYPTDEIEVFCQDCLDLLKNIAETYRSKHEPVVDTECYDILENIVYDIILDEIKGSINKN